LVAVVVFLTGGFLAADFFAGGFLAADFFAGGFLAGIIRPRTLHLLHFFQ
jgi:hypothetical protein